MGSPVLAKGCVWIARATSPSCAGMVFPHVSRAMEEFSVVPAHKSQALLMDCTAHTADPGVTIACLELL